MRGSESTLHNQKTGPPSATVSLLSLSHWCVERQNRVTINFKRPKFQITLQHMGSLGSRSREDICLRPLNQLKWFLSLSGHWYHPANQFPARLRQVHTRAQTKAYGHMAALNPGSSELAGVQEQTTLPQCVHAERKAVGTSRSSKPPRADCKGSRPSSVPKGFCKF